VVVARCKKTLGAEVMEKSKHKARSNNVYVLLFKMVVLQPLEVFHTHLAFSFRFLREEELVKATSSRLMCERTVRSSWSQSSTSCSFILSLSFLAVVPRFFVFLFALPFLPGRTSCSVSSSPSGALLWFLALPARPMDDFGFTVFTGAC